MPTGWEVTLDLVRKLAAVHNETCDPDPERWYQDKFGVPPDYSDLLEQLAKTPSERQQLLRRYWEPNDEEREENRKQPTAAHRAIAAMALRGSIRVIVTTNFDRLIETALTDAGINAAVMSSPDQVQGALPLVHTQCCVFKVHGDYLDARIRNTQTELDEYPSEFNQLLDQIFDQFGLVVCGWSAEWDGALRQAVFRAQSRRFSTYWASRGNPREAALRLIEHRRAEVVLIDDADTFFQEMQDLVQSIDEIGRPHPLSTEAAVSRIKRYLAEPRYRIRLSDLVRNEVDRVLHITSPTRHTVHGGYDGESATARVRSYDAACSTLAAMATVGTAWAEEDHYPIWTQVLERLGVTRSTGGTVQWIRLERYPATLIFYALGLGCVAGHRLRLLATLLKTTLGGGSSGKELAMAVLPPACLFDNARGAMSVLEGMAKRNTPLNDWIYETLYPLVGTTIPSDQYTICFDRFEVIVALNYIQQAQAAGWADWFPGGRFIHQSENREAILQELKDSIAARGAESPFLQTGLLGETQALSEQTLKMFEEGVQKWQWGAWR